MKLLQRIAITLLLLAALLLSAGRIGLLARVPPRDLGVHDGRLKPPSPTANSVSSQARLWPDHPQRDYADIAPFALHEDGPATIAAGRCQDSCRLSSCCQWHTLASSGDRGHDAIPFRVERHGSDG
jgi:hypothetical protein